MLRDIEADVFADALAVALDGQGAHAGAGGVVAEFAFEAAGEGDVEVGSLAEIALDPDAPAVCLGDLLHDGKADSRAPPAVLAGTEALSSALRLWRLSQ